MAQRFNVPPNWPDMPHGWTPPPGWTPDPSWGPAPHGWQFWADEPSTAGQEKKKRNWLAPVIAGASAGVVGLVVGFGIGATAASPEQPVAQTDAPVAEESVAADVADDSSVTDPGSGDDISIDESNPGEMVPGGWGMTMPGENDIHDVKQPAENHGLVMTVNKFVETPTITINDSNYRPDSPYAEWRDVPPDKDGKFFVAETTIKNNTDSALDLTCGAPVDLRLLDVDGKSFGPIENLHEVRGNPECNYQLEPGFESKMTYAFAAPNDAQADMIVFAPTSFDADDYGQPGTGIKVGKEQ